MYEYIIRAINAGGYDLTDMVSRIDKLFTLGKITADQYDECLNLAQDKADNCDGLPDIKTRVMNLEEWRKSVDAKLKEIEGGETPELVPSDEWPDYVQPTGDHNDYNTGDKITYDGKHYICKKDGVVWPPDVYPKGWKYVKDASSNDA